MISYIIPFKDWGLTRLELAVDTAIASLGDAKGEVIVSDFGSTFGPEELEKLRTDLEARGAIYVRTETDGVWSRSRALNAGVAVARGEIFVASDADMLVPPGCLARVDEEISADPNIAVFLSCLDLPERWDDQAIKDMGIDWEVLRRAARRRPRWGMGLNAVSKRLFEKIRGWDERFLIYGGEDNDFAVRIRRAGGRIVWPEGDEFGLLHMWHPSSSASAQQSRATALQVERNKDIYRRDRTFLRNTAQWRHRAPDSPPLVSVVISTYNRADMLGETINSVLIQTMQDFEIIIVDDGSTDATGDFVQGLADPRIRYVRQENAGISAARNRGTREAKGHYIAVLDDDDLMLPWRLESQLGVQEDSPCIAFGTFVNFQDDTGEMIHMGVKPMDSVTTALKGGAPGHSTWLVPTEWMRKVPYDETLSSGVDNDLALRFLRSGMKWNYCGEIVVLRRMHRSQVTVSDNSNQLGSASAALNRLLFNASAGTLKETQAEAMAIATIPPRGLPRMEELVGPYLPDHLVDRWHVRLVPIDEAISEDLVVVRDGQRWGIGVHRLTWSDLVALGPQASSHLLVAEPKGEALGAPRLGDVASLQRREIDQLLSDVLTAGGAQSVGVAYPVEPGSSRPTRVDARGGKSVAIEAATLDGQEVGWFTDWLTNPSVEVAVTSAELDALRHKWVGAVLPGRSQWKR